MSTLAVNRLSKDTLFVFGYYDESSYADKSMIDMFFYLSCVELGLSSLFGMPIFALNRFISILAGY